ncbi:MAG: glycosyltransferase [Phycisphaerae bacterium]
MEHTLLITGGSLGDIRPFVAIAVALERRGVEVTLLTNPAARETVEQAGLRCVVAGRDVTVRQLLRDRPAYMSLRGGELVLKEMFIPASKAVYDAALSEIDRNRPDAIVCHPGCFGGVWAAGQREIPLAMVHLAPTSLLRPADAAETTGGPVWLWRRVLRRIQRAGSGWMRKAAAELGVDWHADLLEDMILGGDVLLGMWSPLFRSPKPDDPPHLRTCGFPNPARINPLPPELDRFLAENAAPIVFGLGSTAVHVDRKVLKAAETVTEKMDRPAVLITGEVDQVQVDGRIARAGFACFDALFPQSHLTVHHGGIGTTTAALRSGRPSLAVPFGHDQFDNGARLKQLGVGGRLWAATVHTGQAPPAAAKAGATGSRGSGDRPR